jgi:hypothetical protein
MKGALPRVEARGLPAPGDRVAIVTKGGRRVVGEVVTVRDDFTRVRLDGGHGGGRVLKVRTPEVRKL